MCRRCGDLGAGTGKPLSLSGPSSGEGGREERRGEGSSPVGGWGGGWEGGWEAALGCATDLDLG